MMNQRIENIQSALLATESILNSLNISPITKSGIDGFIKLIKAELNELLTDSLQSVDETRVRLNTPIELEAFTLYPGESEIMINGKRDKLPSLEFHIIYNLALHAGYIVRFKVTHSFNTHLSVLRRTYPQLKAMIEHVKGVGYRLNVG